CLDKAVEGPWAGMFACTGEELDRQAAPLNDTYKELMSELSRDRKKALLKAQRAWIKFREAKCNYYGDPEGGRAERRIASDCLVTMTAKRAKNWKPCWKGFKAATVEWLTGRQERHAQRKPTSIQLGEVPCSATSVVSFRRL